MKNIGKRNFAVIVTNLMFFRQHFLTKGDNNELDDVSLYPGTRTTVSRDEVVGFVRGYVPFLGWLVIKFQEAFWIKYCLLTVCGMVVWMAE